MARRPPNLHLRIVGLFLIAILPPAILAIGLAWQGYQGAVATKTASLRQAASLVAAREGAIVEGMRRVLASLASQDAIVRAEEPACSRIVTSAVEANSAYAAMAVIQPVGGLACLGGQSGLIESERDASWLAELARRAHTGRRFAVGAAERPEQERIAAAVPITDANNGTATLVLVLRPGYLGAAGFAIPHLENTTAALLGPDWRPISLYLSDNRLDWLPRERPFDARALANVATRGAKGADDRQYVYTVAPVVETDLFVLSAAPVDRIFSAERRQLILSASFPLALLVLSVATAWFAVDRLVLRWIASMREAASAYGVGRLEGRVEVPDDMPAEIRDLAEAFNGMAARVQERSVELESALGEKTRLLRELHHRVKNNFQVIASLLALQKRSLGKEGRALLRYPEDRVQALATAYRLSYASGEIGLVDLAELIEENITYIRQSTEAPPSLLQLDVVAGQTKVDLDTAIPLSLMLAELVVGFADAAKMTGRAARLVIRRESEGGLTLLLTGPAPSVLPGSKALTSRLAHAFVQQLGGRLEVEEGDPAVARVVLPKIGEDPVDAPPPAASGFERPQVAGASQIERREARLA